MKLKVLIGAGDRILLCALPSAVIVVVANVLKPSWFAMGFGLTALIIGLVLLAIGVPAWVASVALVLIEVPRRKLITSGPFAVVRHPLYVAVSLLVLPGLGFLLDSWLVIALGVILYVFARIFSPIEEKALEGVFPREYPAYRSRVLLPWL